MKGHIKKLVFPQFCDFANIYYYPDNDNEYDTENSVFYWGDKEVT